MTAKRSAITPGVVLTCIGCLTIGYAAGFIVTQLGWEQDRREECEEVLRAMPKWVPILQPDGGVDITASDAGYMTLGELTGLGDSAFSMASSEQMGAYVSYLDWRDCGRRMGWE